MILVRTAQSITDAILDLAGGEQASGLDDLALAVDPLGLDRIEPRTLAGKEAGEDAHALTHLLDLAVVVVNPIRNGVADVPGGVVPDQEQDRLALQLELLAAPVQVSPPTPNPYHPKPTVVTPPRLA